MILKSLLLFVILIVCDGKKMWNLELISIDTRTSDPEKITLNMRVKSLPRGQFALHGYMMIGYDLNVSTMIENICYRSQSGREDDYTLMPWAVEKQTFVKFIDKFYEHFYFDFAECSSFPKPEDALPWQMGNITFNECIPEGKDAPDIAPQGYYKVIFKATGDVDWGFDIVGKISDKFVF